MRKNWFQGRFDEQIYSLEATAGKKYLTAIQTAETKMSSGWFRRYLEDCILPTFNRKRLIDSPLIRAFELLASRLLAVGWIFSVCSLFRDSTVDFALSIGFQKR